MENIKKLTVNDIFYDVPYEEFMKLAMIPNFFHGRVNDGEYIAISTIKNPMNVNSRNTDYSNYFMQLGIDLRQVLVEYQPSSNYFISSGKNWFDNYRGMFEEICKENTNLSLNTGYFYYDLLMHPSHFETFNDFLRQKKVVIVGPSYMRDIKLFKNFELIEIPRINAYLTMNDTIKKIAEYNATGEPINYCFTAGMMTSIVIHRFSKIDKKNSYFNIGSVWDYFFQSSKYDGQISHRGIYPRLINEFNSHYEKYIIQ
jgi:hypothetical protein